MASSKSPEDKYISNEMGEGKKKTLKKNNVSII